MIKKFGNTVTTMYRDWRSYRKTRAELSRLTSRELRDLGITKHDIERISMETAFNRH